MYWGQIHGSPSYRSEFNCLILNSLQLGKCSYASRVEHLFLHTQHRNPCDLANLPFIDKMLSMKPLCWVKIDKQLLWKMVFTLGCEFSHQNSGFKPLVKPDNLSMLSHLSGTIQIFDSNEYL